MNRILLIILIAFNVNVALSQTANHWETVVFAGDTWSYFVGNSQPNEGWTNLTYNETDWLSGTGGFGYGDGDDGTEIDKTMSVFLRKKFTVSDLTKLTRAALHTDFDDGFIAYINGVEIARYGINGTLPAYNISADDLHEATLYQGLEPEMFLLSNEKINEILLEGENLLAVQVHNDNDGSSDLSSNFYLSFGITDAETYYSPTPSWFIEPIVFTSNLPIIKINTEGFAIPDDPRIVAKMSVTNYTDRRNSVEDIPNEYNGRITIETRGSSSQMFPKKSYGLETQDPFGENLNVSLLGMPEENDWILYAPYSDKSLIRNVLAYKMANDLGEYASRTRLCEVFLNEQYIGVYVLMEKIKPDKNRVDISKLYPYETSGDDLTGGYILKFDKTTAGADGWVSEWNPWSNQVNIFYHYPDFDDIVNEQKVYIQESIGEFEENLMSENYDHSTLGYTNYMNPRSFIDFMFINEMGKNVDGYRLSSFFYKDKESNGGKINMGPVWDFNLAFGNADYFDDGKIENFSHELNAWASPFWWDRLLQNPSFTDSLQCRWQNLRQTKLHTDTLNNYINSVHNYLEEAQERNFKKWEILNEYVWPNENIGGTYLNEITYLKNWLEQRMVWLDENFPGNCILNSVTDLNIGDNKLEIYPNPFNESTTISFFANETANYTLEIVNLTGQIVYSDKQKAISNTKITVEWEGGPEVTPGFYICKITKNGNYIAAKKIIKK